MKLGLYAGSFDPWSIGHQYVLDQALDVFDEMHVLVAVHPSKKSLLNAEDRVRLVMHAADPTINWWDVDLKQPLILKQKRLTVTTWDGLVVDYAQRYHIQHLVRGMRSTTDFEAEFNLYFANNALDSSLQTWAILCPPRLLHCSSTYIRAVVGHPCAKVIATSFAAQAIMLKRPVAWGQAYDLYYKALQDGSKDLESLQQKFTTLMSKKYIANLKSENDHSKNIYVEGQKPGCLQEATFYKNILNNLG